MKRFILVVIMSHFLLGLACAASGPDVIPEMQECMKAHGSQAEYAAVLKKYCDPGIIRQAMGLLVIKNPYVIKTEQKGKAFCYTVEGATVETSSEFPADTIQTYNVCWERGRIASLEFYGAKPGIHQEILPQMLECMRSHGTPSQYEKVLKKYCDPGIIHKAMGLLVIKTPSIVKTEKKGPVIVYTVEGRTAEASGGLPVDTIQKYKVGWKNGRIVSLDFLGQNK
jgi:hypothetical protein